MNFTRDAAYLYQNKRSKDFRRTADELAQSLLARKLNQLGSV